MTEPHQSPEVPTRSADVYALEQFIEHQREVAEWLVAEAEQNADGLTDVTSGAAHRFAAAVVRRHCDTRRINHLDAGDLEAHAREIEAETLREDTVSAAYAGPWQRKGNGNTVTPHPPNAGWNYCENRPDGSWAENHTHLPDDAIPLVPLSEVDAVKAELAEAKEGQAEADRVLAVTRDDLASITAQYWSVHATAEALQDMANRESPSLPVHGTPEWLRSLADSVEKYQRHYAPEHWEDTADMQSVDAVTLRADADRLEAARVREATHTAAIEAGAKVLAEMHGDPWVDLPERTRENYRISARALVDAGADLTGLVDGASE